MNANELLSTTEAAEILGVSRVTIFNKIISGEIEAIKVGRNYVIEKKEIDRLLGGGGLSEIQKKELDKGVNRVVKEYGETLELLKNS